MTGVSRALYFDKDVTAYDIGRPGYPKELYEAIKLNIPGGAERFLEIGAGNGVASQELLAILNPKALDLLEPGENFCNLLRQRYNHDKRVSVVRGDFENYQPTQKYDTMIAATAWHWPDLLLKYKHAKEALNPKGLLVVFWNNFHLVDGGIKDKIDKVYRKYDPNYELHIDQLAKTIEHKSEFQQSQYFEIIFSHVFKSKLILDSKQYVNLLKTYPDHEKFGAQFLLDIERVVEDCDGTVGIQLLTDLIIGQKKE